MSIKLNSNIKSVSHHKLNRLMNRDDVEKGQVYWSVPNTFESFVATPAVRLDDFIYFRIPCRKQPEDRLKMVTMRINQRDYEHDKYLAAFVPTPHLYPVF